MTSYNGHRSWNAWNVSLWFNNDEGLYRTALAYVRQYGKAKAARLLAHDFANERTPDGARYNLTCIREALNGMEA